MDTSAGLAAMYMSGRKRLSGRRCGHIRRGCRDTEGDMLARARWRLGLKIALCIF